MMRAILWAAAFLFPGVACAQVVTLPQPPESVAAARDGVDVYLLNEGAEDATVAIDDTMTIRTADGESLTIVRADPAPATLAPGAFARLRYRPVIAVADRADEPTLSTPAGFAPPSGEVAVASAAGTGRGFLSRFEPGAPIYGVFGAGDAGAKLQVGFAFRPFEDAGVLDGVRFAWTQTMFWAIDEPSGPFRSTNYAPELFVEHGLGGGWTGAVGYRHDSNGRGDLRSIDANRIIVRAARRFDLGGEWEAELAPQAWVYVGRQGAAPDLDRYWGNVSLDAAIGRRDGVRASVSMRGNPSSGKGAGELFLSYPLVDLVPGFGVYAFAQGFTGYGEAIDDYATRSTAVRLGIALTR